MSLLSLLISSSVLGSACAMRSCTLTNNWHLHAMSCAFVCTSTLSLRWEVFATTLWQICVGDGWRYSWQSLPKNVCPWHACIVILFSFNTSLGQIKTARSLCFGSFLSSYKMSYIVSRLLGASSCVWSESTPVPFLLFLSTISDNLLSLRTYFFSFFLKFCQRLTCWPKRVFLLYVVYVSSAVQSAMFLSSVRHSRSSMPWCLLTISRKYRDMVGWNVKSKSRECTMLLYAFAFSCNCH